MAAGEQESDVRRHRGRQHRNNAASPDVACGRIALCRKLGNNMTGGIDLHPTGTTIGDEDAIHQRERFGAMVLSVADDTETGVILRVGVFGFCQRTVVGRPLVGSMPRPRRPENPSPPATTSTRSRVLIFAWGSRVRTGRLWRMERQRTFRAHRRPPVPIGFRAAVAPRLLPCRRQPPFAP